MKSLQAISLCTVGEACCIPIPVKPFLPSHTLYALKWEWNNKRLMFLSKKYFFIVLFCLFNFCWGNLGKSLENLFEVTENNTWINPFAVWDVSMGTLVKERIIQFCDFINNVREKWPELCIYYFPTAINSWCCTPVKVPLTGPYLELEFFIPLLSGYFCQQFCDFYIQKKTTRLVTSVITLQWLLSAKEKPISRSRFTQRGISWNREHLTEIVAIFFYIMWGTIWVI